MKAFLLSLSLLSYAIVSGQDSLKVVQLEEIAITAIRAQSASPVTQSTIKRSEIQSVHYSQDATLSLERLTPSLITFSDAGTSFGNYHQLRMRGVDQSRINMTLNGVPLNDMIDQGVFFANFPDFMSSMESIQAQRGVGLSSNGTSSFAGSISYESFDITNPDFFGQVSSSIGSFSSFGVNAQVYTGRGKNGFSTYVRASKTYSDGYKYNSGSDAHSFFLTSGRNVGNGFLKITALAGRTQNQQAYSPVLLADIKNDSRTNYFPKQDEDDFKQELVQAEYSLKIGSKVGLSITGYYGGARGYFPFTFGPQYVYSIKNDHYGSIVNIARTGERSKLSGGIHLYRFDRENQSATSTTLDDPYYADDTRKNEVSTFLKWEKDLGDMTILLDAQLRNVESEFASDTLTKYSGNHVAARSETFLNPRLGLTYQISNLSNLYISFGRTGREPTRIDLMQGDFDGVQSWNYTAFTDNSVVKSEYVNDLELGYRYYSENLRLSVNGFYMAFENEISQVGGLVQNSYFALRQNVKRSQRMGVELDSDYLFDSGIMLGIMATFMKSNVNEFDTGVELLKYVQHVFSPNSMIMPSVGWKSEKLSVGLDGAIVSESFMELSNDPEYTLPSYSVINFSFGAEVSSKISLSARVNNLFNEQYFTDGAPVDFEYDGIPEGPGYRIQAPRNFMIQARFKL